jgi:hypothetical protein
MSNPDAYIRQIHELDAAIKRNIDHGRKLRQQREQVNLRLYNYMQRHHLEEYGGIRIKAVSPKTRMKRKSMKQKKKEAVELFTQIGIPDPDGFWLEFQSTQKNTEPPM